MQQLMITVNEVLRRMAAKSIRCISIDRRHEDGNFGLSRGEGSDRPWP